MSSSLNSISPFAGLDNANPAVMIAQMRSWSQREDLPIDSMILLRSAYFEALTVNAEEMVDVAKLNDAIAAGESLVAVLPSGHEALVNYLDKLGFLKASRYNVNREKTDIDDAIGLGRRALSLATSNDPSTPNIMSNLAYNLCQRYKGTNNLQDLDESIHLTQKIVRKLTPGETRYPGYLSNLGARLYLKYQKTGEMEVFNEAIKVTQQVLQVTGPEDYAHNTALLNSGVYFAERYNKTGSWRDLEEAIRLQRICMDTLPSPPGWRFNCAVNLATLYEERFETTKNITDVKEAARYLYEAVQALTPSVSMQSTRSQYFTNYLRVLGKHVRATTELRDVVTAISDAAELLNTMPEIYADLILNLRSYGELLGRKFELSGHPMDLYHAVTGAIQYASQFNHVTRLKGEPTQYDCGALLRLSRHAGYVATEPNDNPLVVQVMEANHREYLNLVKTLTCVDALLKLECDVSSTVQIIIIASRERSFEDMEAECNEKIEYLEKLGAKQYQLRFKMVDLTLGYADSASSTDPTDELRKRLAQCTFASEGDSLAEDSRKSLVKLQKESYSHLYHQYTRGIADSQAIATAVRSSETLLNIITSEPLDRSAILDRLSSIYYLLYDLNKAETYLLKSSIAMKESLQLKSTSYDDDCGKTRINVLCFLAHALRFRHVQTGGVEILKDSMTFANEVISSTKPFVPIESGRNERNAMYLSGKTALAKVLRSQYLLSGNVGSLDDAIECIEEVLRLRKQAPNSATVTQDSSDSVNQYALMMRSRFDERGKLGDLDCAITHLQEFITHSELSPTDKAVVTSNLGMLCEQRCERTKASADIRRAIHYCEEAIRLFKDAKRSSAGPCINLGSTLLQSYLQSKSRTDLARAVECAVMALGDDTDETHWITLLDAAIIFKVSYQCSKDLTELEKAREYMEEAMLHLPLSHTHRPLLMYEHGEILEEIHCLRPSTTGIDRAIEAYQNAFAYVSSARGSVRLSAAHRVICLLGKEGMWAELSLFLEKTIECMKIMCPTWLPIEDRQYFLSLVPGLPSDTAAALLRSSASNAYKAVQSLESSRGIILGSVMDYRREAKLLEVVSPDHVREWNHICMELDSLSQEKMPDGRATRRQILSKAMRDLTKSIREIPFMGSFSGSVIHGTMEAYDLQTRCPEYFEAFNTLQREFDYLPVEDKSGGREIRRQQDLISKLNDLRSTIRSIPGLENFTSPLPEKSLLDLACRGPIVIVNSSNLMGRSDTIIIQPSGIEVLRLPMLRYADVENWMNERDNAVSGWTLRTFSQHNARMREVLKWLWQTAVKPILTHLKMISVVFSNTRPQIYWIGTGRLSTAPFHAAGEHGNHSTENTFSHVTSTYVSTLRALSFARETSAADETHSNSNRRLLIAASASAPGAAALALVEKEVSQVTETTSHYLKVIRNSFSTPTSVLSELPLANIVHFACHAISDPNDLANSHLLLHADPTPFLPYSSSDSDALTSTLRPQFSRQDQNKLTVRSISAERSPSAELAYLSACSAAEIRNSSLSDESIHIVSAFQLAGFRNVVGTLWQTKDDCCREVAVCFYRKLFGRSRTSEEKRRQWIKREKQERDDSKNNDKTLERFLPVAEALHDAIVELRQKNPEKVLAWAPFVCFGA